VLWLESGYVHAVMLPGRADRASLDACVGLEVCANPASVCAPTVFLRRMNEPQEEIPWWPWPKTTSKLA
jgi:hypothetical protein